MGRGSRSARLLWPRRDVFGSGYKCGQWNRDFIWLRLSNTRKIPEATCIRSDSGDVVYVCADDSSVCLGEPIMTAADAARQLGVTPGRVSQLITAGKLVAERMAGGTWVAVSSVEEYSRSTRSPGRPKKQLWRRSQYRGDLPHISPIAELLLTRVEAARAAHRSYGSSSLLNFNAQVEKAAEVGYTARWHLWKRSSDAARLHRWALLARITSCPWPAAFAVWRTRRRPCSNQMSRRDLVAPPACLLEKDRRCPEAGTLPKPG